MSRRTLEALAVVAIAIFIGSQKPLIEEVYAIFQEEGFFTAFAHLRSGENMFILLFLFLLCVFFAITFWDKKEANNLSHPPSQKKNDFSIQDTEKLLEDSEEFLKNNTSFFLKAFLIAAFISGVIVILIVDYLE